MASSSGFSDSLCTIDPAAVARSVTAVPVTVGGRRATQVELRDEVTLYGVPGRDYIDEPTMLQLPVSMRHGTLEVSLRSQLNGKTDFDARGFAGLAFGIIGEVAQFESVYLRPLNGRTLEPMSPRSRRAVQYFAYPDWKFDRLRAEYPDGRYEAGADIEPGRWSTLRLEIAETNRMVWVDDVPVLTISVPKVATVSGRIGLFVDIGTVAQFADLHVQPAAS